MWRSRVPTEKNAVAQACATAPPQVGQHNDGCFFKMLGHPAQFRVRTTLRRCQEHRHFRAADLNGKTRKMTALAWLRVRWRLALLLSLVLHTVGLLALTRLPGRACHYQQLPSTSGDVGPPEGDEECEAGAFLVRPALPRRPAAPLAAPQAQPLASAPVAAGPSPPPAPLVTFPSSGPKHHADHGTFASADGTGAAGPGPATTTFFQVPVEAERVVYVIDHSGSMGLHGALEAAARELLNSLERLPRSAHFQVIVYNSAAGPLLVDQPGWLAVSPENTHRVAAALRDLPAEGGTRQDQALFRALTLQPEAIFFLTDADDLSAADVSTIMQRNRWHCVIHVIELNTANSNRPDMPLQVLARENGGVYRAVELERR
jgi:hypothetical protein